MSCTVSLLKVMLSEVLLSERDATREWLRAHGSPCEMDRLVDPMFDSIFNRLQTKLTNEFERTANVPLHQPFTLITQPSTSTLNPQSSHQPPSIEPENNPEILAEVKREIEEEREMQLNMHNNPINNREYGNQMDGEQSINWLERTQSAGGNGELTNPTEHELRDVNLCQSYQVDTQPSTLNPQSNQQPPSIDCEPENDPKILAKVLPEIEEEERQMQLNMHNNHIDNRQLELQVNGDQSINGLERAQSGADDCAQVRYHDDQLCPPPNQLYQASFGIGQPSTSSHLMSPHQNVHYSHQQPNDNPIHSDDNSNQQAEMRPTVQLTTPPNVQVNSAQVYNDELCNESSGTVQHSSSLPATIVNEQFNQNLNAEDEGEGECDCDECLNGIEIDDEVEVDDDDSVQLIEEVESDQEVPRPVKRPRMDPTQPNNAQAEVAGQSPRPANDEAQPNQNRASGFITIHLKCPLSECPVTFPEVYQLNQHMSADHLIGPFRCLVKDCGLFFDSSHLFGKHKESHELTTQLHCSKCPKHFSKYESLYHHNYAYHQLGHFQCSFPACTFTGEYKQIVRNHHQKQHKLLECSQMGCDYQTYIRDTMKAHELSRHLGIKPFRCKWLNCHFASAYPQSAVKHIKAHLDRFQCPNQSVAHSTNPRDYLEVVSELS